MSAAIPKPPTFGEPGPVKVAPNRFDTVATMTGHAVIDFDGRPVAEREDYSEARDIVGSLNEAAHGGGRALASAIARLR